MTEVSEQSLWVLGVVLWQGKRWGGFLFVSLASACTSCLSGLYMGLQESGYKYK